MELFFILYIIQSVNGYFQTVNHSKAQDACNGYGELALYEDFDEQDRKLTIRGEETNAMTLNEGESAWIQGYADYSTILSLFGCYEITIQDTFNSITMSENNEYSCSEHCVMNTNNTEYIALIANVCICLTFEDLNLMPKRSCTQTQSQHWLNRADTGLTNVYEIHDYEKLQWINQVGLQQCVYAKIQGDAKQRTVKYETDSCFSSLKRGFICTTSYNLHLNDTCKTYHMKVNNTPAICFTSENSSWVEAKKLCCEYKGKLIAEVFTSVRFYADTNRTYWTGMFRPFSVQNVSTGSCLSATRVKNTLVLDPDNCSKKKRFLCRDNITQIKITTSSITTTPLNTESTNKTTDEATVVSKKNEIKSAAPKYYIYVGIGVCALFVVTLTIIIVVYKIRKNNIKRESEAQEFENNFVCTEPNNGIDSMDGYVSSVEDNLENKTKDICMQDYCYDTAEQYSVVNTKFSKKETDYDRVHLVLQNKGKKTENVDGNIYDHTKDLSDQDQYHVLGNVDLKKLQNKTDDTYGKLQTKESEYDTMAQAKALTASSNTYAHLS